MDSSLHESLQWAMRAMFSSMPLGIGTRKRPRVRFPASLESLSSGFNESDFLRLLAVDARLTEQIQAAASGTHLSLQPISDVVHVTVRADSSARELWIVCQPACFVRKIVETHSQQVACLAPGHQNPSSDVFVIRGIHANETSGSASLTFFFRAPNVSLAGDDLNVVASPALAHFLKSRSAGIQASDNSPFFCAKFPAICAVVHACHPLDAAFQAVEVKDEGVREALGLAPGGHDPKHVLSALEKHLIPVTETVHPILSTNDIQSFEIRLQQVQLPSLSDQIHMVMSLDDAVLLQLIHVLIYLTERRRVTLGVASLPIHDALSMLISQQADIPLPQNSMVRI